MGRVNTPDPLSGLHIASPCSAKWEEMSGDDRVRHCGHCRLNVYNLSVMDVEEAAELLAADSESLCLRLYRRSDGTILTRNCPSGTKAQASRRRWRTQDVAAAVAGSLIVGSILMPTSGAYPRPAARRIALQMAAASGDLQRIEALLSVGVDPNARVKDGYTPLMYAAAHGQNKAIRLLLRRGADASLREPHGLTALQIARREGFPNSEALLRSQEQLNILSE
jgi:hypothetical protein